MVRAAFLAAWLGAPGPAAAQVPERHIPPGANALPAVRIERNPRMVERYSNCPFANPNDSSPDDDELQACLDLGGIIQLTPGNPGYIIRKGLRVTRQNTTLTSNRYPDKAFLIADPALAAPILRGGGDASGLTLEYLFLDGNKANRRVDCRGYRDYGSNLSFHGGIRGLTIQYVESSRAMCGSAMEVYATDFEIAHCVLKDNGYDAVARPTGEPWADGITVGLCANGRVHDNVVENSTDIGIVSGGGKNCKVERNIIKQTNTHAFAGLAVHSFPGAGEGDQEGSVYQQNVVTAEGTGTIDFGISVGIHTWFPEQMTTGGTVTGNRVKGAGVNIAVDGFSKGTVAGNLIEDPGGPGHLRVSDCAIKAPYTAAHVESGACLQGGYVTVSFHGRCAEEEYFRTPCNGPPPDDPRYPRRPRPDR